MPLLTLEDVGPNPGDWFTRVTLTADDRPALVAEMSFLIDRSFARMLLIGAAGAASVSLIAKYGVTLRQHR